MPLPSDSAQHLQGVVVGTLDSFDKIASAAEASLKAPPGLGVDSLASVNTMTGDAALENMAAINRERAESFRTLAREPAISRVVVQDEKGQRVAYLICRAATISAPGIDAYLANYRAPAGRLASLSIGDTLVLPNGTVEVLESTRLHPEKLEDGWESRNTVVETADYGPLTVASFRALLRDTQKAHIELDLLQRMLSEESEASNVLEGIRRSVIVKMGLRDQPVLDKFQDEIFRLPLDIRLVVLGPPGTGKTTTLIRRLGQKLDLEHLNDGERDALDAEARAGRAPHESSWLMFTPTDLLKQYVKEAFNRENIPASDQRIKTWADYRRELARSVFGVLRTAAGGGIFVYRETTSRLEVVYSEDLIPWFEDFNGWQRQTFFADLSGAASILSEHKGAGVAAIGKRLLGALETKSGVPLDTIVLALSREIAGVQGMISDMKAVTDRRIEEALNLQLNRDKSFLAELARFIDALRDTLAGDVDDLEDADVEDDDDLTPVRVTGIANAATAYMRAVRAHARAFARKRSVTPGSRNAKIIEWIGDRIPNQAALAEVGESLVVQSGLRRFVNPARAFLTGVPRRYRAFRRVRHGEGKWYRGDNAGGNDISPLELDMVLLAILTGGNELLSNRSIERDLGSPVWSALESVNGLLKNQVLVDEATDFSPIQLACMAALVNPRIRSFFACGDFNQRLTSWGTRSKADLEWVYRDIETRQVTVTYRQSKQLNEFCKAIVRASGGSDVASVLPDHVDSEGVLPVLVENLGTHSEIADWLASRIVEIERYAKQLPSIAVLVNAEGDVQPMASALDDLLQEHSIRAVPCPNGQVIGQTNDVRVFDIQHIKGLEFEAVFFVGIDLLAKAQPDLFDKYLYVGATRAATFLGVTCGSTLPSSIAPLNDLFGKNWAAS